MRRGEGEGGRDDNDNDDRAGVREIRMMMMMMMKLGRRNENEEGAEDDDKVDDGAGERGRRCVCPVTRQHVKQASPCHVYPRLSCVLLHFKTSTMHFRGLPRQNGASPRKS